MQNSSIVFLKFLERVSIKTFKRSLFKKIDSRKAAEAALQECPGEEKEEKAPVPCRERPEPLYDARPSLEKRGVCTVDPCDPEKCFPQPRIVIIGAGMAGLAAAVRLLERNITNFVVLEAYERPGGRIQSGWIGDVVADLGALWRTDSDYNSPVYSLTASEDPPRPGVPAAENPRGLFTGPIGEKIPRAPIIAAYCKFRQIEQEAAAMYCYGDSKSHGSLIQFISLRIQQELHHFPEDHQYSAARIMYGLLHMLSTRCGIDTAMLCCDHQGCFMHAPGSEVTVPLGSIAMLAPLLRQLPHGFIRYCRPVSHIYWGTCPKVGHRAIVCCGDGDEYPADYVIITVSLGVLFNRGARMFCPELPASKISAMNCLGYGHCNKVFMEYGRPFWFWQKTELNFKFGCGNGSTGWTNGVTAIEVVQHSKYVICAWLVGPEAMLMETLCDRDVAEGLTQFLRWATGCSDIPYPQAILRSHWGSDPFFHGGYSFESCCSNGDAQRALACPLPGPADPIPPILLFAGEATVPGHFATIAGARLSGIREAERICSLTRQYKGPPYNDYCMKKCIQHKLETGEKETDKPEKLKIKAAN